MKKQIKRSLVMIVSIIIIILIISNNQQQVPSEVEKQSPIIDGLLTSGVSDELSKMLKEDNAVKISINQTDIVTVSSSIEENFITGYTTTTVRVRKEPNGEILDLYKTNTEVKYIIENDDWVKIIYNDEIAYISKHYITNNKITNQEKSDKNNNVLTKKNGVCYGPSGKETYYNLNMNGVVKIMRDMGNNDEYWVREDGCKMLGDYIMVAADLNTYPRGSIVQTSLGEGIVCDTGSFTSNGSGVSLDIATNW